MSAGFTKSGKGDLIRNTPKKYVFSFINRKCKNNPKSALNESVDKLIMDLVYKRGIQNEW